MGGFCPRRTVLDALLVNAAAESGAEVREGFTVDELLIADDTVIGIRGHAKGMKPVEERARIVIGADGVNSFVARTVRAPEYDAEPVAACAYYSVLQRPPTGRYRAVRSGARRLWRRTDERRPPSGDGELADQGLSDHPQ